MNIRQCFETLELGADASLDDVNQAYKDLVTVWHPDRFSTNPRLGKKAEEKLKKLNQAYEKTLQFLSSKQNPQPFGNSHGEPATGPGSSGIPEGTVERGSPFHSNKEISAELQQRPYRRFFARLIDYLLLGLASRMIGADTMFPSAGIRTLIIPVFLSLAWIIPEAILLSLFGSTPGKWLLKTTVVDIFQLKPKFSSALRRSLSVWCNGLGMGVLFIAPATALLAWFRLKIKGSTVWDRDGRFSVKYGRIGAPRLVAAFLSAAVITLFFILGPNIMIGAYRQVVRINPDDPKAHLNLGASYAKVGRYNKAVEFYTKAIRIKPDYAPAYKKLGFCYVSLQRYGDALAPLKKALKISPDDAQVWYGLGICYHKLQLSDEAIEAFKHAIKLKPDDAQALHELAICYSQLGRYDEAIEKNNRATEIKPDYAAAYSDLGICYYRLRRTEEAIRAIKRALKISPDDAKGRYRLGLCYIDLGHYNKAIEAFKKAIRIKPRFVEGFFGLGVCYAKLDRSDEAVVALKKAIEIKPDYIYAYHILGLTYLSLGKKKSAFEQYEILKKLDKDLAEELLDYIENMPISSGS